jgi:hypothetical protein
MTSSSEVKAYLKYAELANAAYAFEAIYRKGTGTFF